MKMSSRLHCFRGENEYDVKDDSITKQGKLVGEVRPTKKARHSTCLTHEISAGTVLSGDATGASKDGGSLGQGISSSSYNSTEQVSLPTYLSRGTGNHVGSDSDAQLRGLSGLTHPRSTLPDLLQDAALLNANTYPFSATGVPSFLQSPTLSHSLDAQRRLLEGKILTNDLKSYIEQKALDDAATYGSILSAEKVKNALLTERLMKLEYLRAAQAETSATRLLQQIIGQKYDQSDLLHQKISSGQVLAGISGASSQFLGSDQTLTSLGAVDRSTIEEQVKDNATPSFLNYELPFYLPRALSISQDKERLSTYQCLLRKQIEVFEAEEDDVRNHAKGRSKPVCLGQVGIRCRHCKGSSSQSPRKGSAYFPSTLLGVYQAAQNMALYHMNTSDSICSEMAQKVRDEFNEMLPCKSTVGGGKEYWADAAKAIGLVDTSNGIRFCNAVKRSS